MKHWMAVAACMLIVSPAMADNIEIKATKKKVDSHRGSQQQLPRGSTRYSEDHVLYEFSVKARSVKVPSMVKVQWMLLVEGADGRVSPGTRGEKEVDLKLNKAVKIESDTVTLRQREWTHRGGAGEIEDELYGYGIRVLSLDGETLTEKYSSSKAESYVTWKKEGNEAPRPGQPRQTPGKKKGFFPWRR